MMKFTAKLLLLAACLILALSCARDTEMFGDELPGAPVANEVAEKGHIRVKITPDFEEKMIAASKTGGVASTGDLDLDELARAIGARSVERTFPHGGKFEERMRREGLHLWYEVYFDEHMPATRAMDGFTGLTGVQIVEQSYIPVAVGESKIVGAVSAGTQAATIGFPAPAAVSFNDPMLPQQWHYNNDGSLATSVAGADINLFAAWAVETGNPAVVVCVQDGGVDFQHEDLSANMWRNEAELNGAPGVDDDGNGYIDDIYGWNFYDDIATISPNDHATHVAGTVAAVNNNGTGVSGVAGGHGAANSGVRIMTCQLASVDGVYTNSTNIKRSFIYAAHNGAVISQNSWGYPPSVELPQSDKEAIDYFIRYAGLDENGNQTGPLKGGLVIFAAGNHASTRNVYPAALDQVIAVAAMGPDFKAPYYSNNGAYIDLTAPGGNNNYGSSHMVVSTGRNNRYITMEGTSMACPHVSGIAALVVSKFGVGNPGLTPKKVREILLAAANEDIYIYNPAYIFLGERRLGKGYIDAYKAVMTEVSLTDTPPAAVSNLAVEWSFNSAVLQWSVVADVEDAAAAYYDIALSTESLSDMDFDAPPAGAIVQSAAFEGKSAGESVSVTIEELAGDTYYNIAIAARDNDGNRSAVAVLSGKTLSRLQSQDADLYPNPVVDVLNIRMGEDVSGTIRVDITNSKGIKVFGTQVNISPAAPAVIDMSKMAAGGYTVTITHGEKKITRNISKI